MVSRIARIIRKLEKLLDEQREAERFSQEKNMTSHTQGFFTGVSTGVMMALDTVKEAEQECEHNNATCPHETMSKTFYDGEGGRTD